MTTKEMIEVMQAYDRGEQIERRDRCGNYWFLSPVPTWDWVQYEYRVKPAYRPYKNAIEFLAAQKEHGMNLQLKGHNYYGLPLYITNILIGIQWPQGDGSTVDIDVSYEELLREYTWQDETPCGVKES